MEHKPKQDGILESELELELELGRWNVWTKISPLLHKFSHLTFFVDGKSGKSYTYDQIRKGSLRWGKELLNYFHGNTPPTVSIIFPNNIEYPMVALGSLAVGAPVCCIRDDYSPDLAFEMITKTNTSVLVIESSALEKFRMVLEKLKNVKVFVRGPDRNHEGEDLFRILFEGDILDEEFAKKVDPESLGIIAFSSGTTGSPKGIPLTQRVIMNQVICHTHSSVFPVATNPQEKQEILLASLPFGHMYGFVFYFISMITNGYKVIESELQDAFSLAEAFKMYKPSVATIRSVMVSWFLEIEGDLNEVFGSLRTLMTVASPPNPDSLRKLECKLNNGFRFMNVYGLSEIGVSIVTPMNCSNFEATGKPIPCVKAKLIDLDNGRVLHQPHTNGELCLHSPGVMGGYLNNAEATAEAFDESGWFRTGDVCYYDEQGFIYYVERYKDVIHVRGKKVFPMHVENVLKKHDSVSDAGVIGVSESVGVKDEVAMAFVVRKGPVEKEQLEGFVESNAPPECWLRGGIEFVDKLPRNHMGKLERKFLREKLWYIWKSSKSHDDQCK